MFFTVKNKRYLSTDQLRTKALINAYYTIKNYPLRASDLALDNFIQHKYKVSLKDLCIKLLLNLTFYKNDSNDLILLFKDFKYDQMARLVTYGDGVTPGSKILQIALNT